MDIERDFNWCMRNADTRECLIKMLQYAVIIYYSVANRRNHIGKRLFRVFAFTRKLLRVGLPISVGIEIFKYIRDLKAFRLKIWLVSDVLQILYYLIDHLLLLIKLKLVFIDTTNWVVNIEQMRNFAWLFRSLTRIICDSLQLHKIIQKIDEMVRNI